MFPCLVAALAWSISNGCAFHATQTQTLSMHSERSLTLRRGLSSDVPLLRARLLREKMNPLALNPPNFVVALDDARAEPVGFGQLRPLAASLSELASLVVEPDHRGLGVGSTIVKELLRRTNDTVVLLTLSGTRSFYLRLGFEESPPLRLPPALLAEYLVGSLVARVFASDGLIILTREPTYRVAVGLE